MPTSLRSISLSTTRVPGSSRQQDHADPLAPEDRVRPTALSAADDVADPVVVEVDHRVDVDPEAGLEARDPPATRDERVVDRDDGARPDDRTGDGDAGVVVDPVVHPPEGRRTALSVHLDVRWRPEDDRATGRILG
jgi:hypothetical protein